MVAEANMLLGFIFKVKCTNLEGGTDIPEQVFSCFFVVPPPPPPVNLATVP
jgi:hypothetical protein